MNKDIPEILDAALEMIRAGEPLDVVLSHFPDNSQELMPLLSIAQSFQELESVEMPSQTVLRSDRSAFIAQTRSFQEKTVSLPVLVRLKEWTRSSMSWIKPPVWKEKNIMATFLIRAAVALILVFASAGGTIALADNSLPDSTLYPAKLAMEQVQLKLTGNPEKKAVQNLVMAQERVTEMVRMAKSGEEAGEGTMLKLEQHLNTALQLAAHLGENGMNGVLNQAQQMIQTQLKELNQTRTQTQEPCEECICQAIRLLERTHARVQEGLQDGNQFRLRYQFGQQEPIVSDETELPGARYQYGQDGEDKGAGPGEQYGNPDCPDCDPVGDANKYGQENGGPNASAGPGPQYQNQDCDCCESLTDDYGTDGPGPGGQYGNPDCDICVPAGDENKYGQENGGPNASSGPGEPGGNQSCTNCDPDGEKNMNGGPAEEPGSGGPGGPSDSGGSGGSGKP